MTTSGLRNIPSAPKTRCGGAFRHDFLVHRFVDGGTSDAHWGALMQVRSGRRLDGINPFTEKVIDSVAAACGLGRRNGLEGLALCTESKIIAGPMNR
jgi:hypothetical protein